MSSQGIFGSVSSTQSLDYGDFIRIGHARVRKDLVRAYMPAQSTDPDGKVHFSVNFMLDSGWSAMSMGTGADVEAEIARIDRLFETKAPAHLAIAEENPHATKAP